jgi:tetratricopeptide (TPR) repeat protein
MLLGIAPGVAGTMLEQPSSLHPAIKVIPLRPLPFLYSFYLLRAESQVKEKKMDEAAATLRQAVKLPLSVQARGMVYQRLGRVCQKSGELADAIAAYRAAVRDLPNNPEAHFDLGFILDDLDWNQAVASLQTAVRLQPDFAKAHLQLAYSLLSQGKVQEARTHVQRCKELLKKKDIPWDRFLWDFSELLLSDLDQAAQLDDWLTKQRGKKPPKFKLSEAEAPEIGFYLKEIGPRLCTARGFHVTAAAHYYYLAIPGGRSSFKDQLGYLFHAASALAQASCGLGVEANLLNDQERKEYRKAALEILHQILKKWTEILEAHRLIPEIRSAMHEWQLSPELSCVRDSAALAKLPADEQQAWNQLWKDVQHLLEKARKEQ